MAELCIHCGLPAEEHHEFETLAMPAGCVCDVGTWAGTPVVTPVCDRFDGEPGQYCGNCDHDEACHAVAGGDQ